MDIPKAYLNGQILPISEMALPVTDAGFVLGTSVTEQMRTFSGKLFEIDSHLQRLSQSLQIVGIQPRETTDEIKQIAIELVANNYRLLDPQDDLGLSLFITPGTLSRFGEPASDLPCVGLHTFPLPFGMWKEKYQTGQSLVVTHVEQVSSRCWPAELKCRSRMHYYLADQAAHKIEEGARALLLDSAGQVIETSTANILIYKADGEISTPPEDAALAGISLLYLEQLTKELGIPWRHRPLVIEEVLEADEVFLSSTPFGLLPVTRFNGQAIGQGKPGPVFHQLIAHWSEQVGVDLIAQARRFAERA